MIRIKDYILNENSVMQIDKCCGGLTIQVENGSIHIEDATFEDIEWNYDSQERQYNEETEQLISSLQIKNYKLQDKIKELEEENKTLKELNVCVGCNNNPDYKSRIDKAIVYIGDRLYYNAETGEFALKCTFDKSDLYKLYTIIKGEENE